MWLQPANGYFQDRFSFPSWTFPPDFCGASLQRSARRHARGPGPLEVEAAEVAGHVHDFADEVKTGNFAASHRFGGQFVGIDAAGGDFGFLAALRARGRDGPRMRVLLKTNQRGVRPRGGSMQFEPAVCEANWQSPAELCP